MKLTRSISYNELVCKCGCKQSYDEPAKIAYYAQQIVDGAKKYFSKDCYIIINSACRCEKHNKLVGGASASKHLKHTSGDAIDFNLIDKADKQRVNTNDVIELIDTLFNDSKCALGYAHFIHFDTRLEKVRKLSY